MTEVYAGINGVRLTNVRVLVGNVGPWSADADCEGDAPLSGKVTLTIDKLKLIGTVVDSASGTFALQRKLRIVGGAAGWAVQLPAKGYHNDANVKAKVVAEDAARAVGEQLGSFVPTAERLGVDYVRQVGPASRALENAAGGAPWWVDYDGVTHVGTRPASSTPADAYEVLAFDPRDRVATLAVDDLAAVQIGSVLAEHLDSPQTIRELELVVTPDELRVRAWCGGTDVSYGALAGLLRGIIQRTMDAKLWGKYRYRVARMNGDRVELQAVRKVVGLPDLLPISMWPGVAGVHSILEQGAEVLIEFLEGDRAQPVLTHFAGKGAPGFVPVSVTLGGSDGAPAARQGDAVETLLPPAVLQGTLTPPGSAITGVLTFVQNKALGTITGGSGKVKIA